MDFAEKFLNRLSAVQAMFLHKHYEKYVDSTSVASRPSKSFIEWVQFYKDLPNILWSMTK